MFENEVEALNREISDKQPVIEEPLGKRTYTVEELAQILEVGKGCIYILLKKHEFRWVKVGGKHYRISKKSFDDWLDNQPD